MLDDFDVLDEYVAADQKLEQYGLIINCGRIDDASVHAGRSLPEERVCGLGYKGRRRSMPERGTTRLR